MPTKAKQVYIV